MTKNDLLTKTVSDCIHDGKNEVETVADVQRNQDVVKAIPHLFPVKRKSHQLLFWRLLKMKTLHLEGCTHDAIDAALSLSFLVIVQSATRKERSAIHGFEFFVERKNSTLAIGQLSFCNTASPNYWLWLLCPIRRRIHISLTNANSECVLSLTYLCWGSKIIIIIYLYLPLPVPVPTLLTQLSTWLAQWCWKYFQEVQVRPPASWSPTSPLKTVKNQVCRKYLGLLFAHSW